jgi:TRAP-type C4-dicarboxylate transport system permease small subunit
MLRSLFGLYEQALRIVVYALAILSGLSVMAIMIVTCVDVILRHPWVGHPVVGAYDIVKIGGAISLAAALPYTTAVKGHVAIDFLVRTLGPAGRWVLSSLISLMSIGLFAFFAVQSVRYGLYFHTVGQVSQTSEIPIFWVPCVIGGCCVVVVLVLVHGLVCPKRELARP